MTATAKTLADGCGIVAGNGTNGYFCILRACIAQQRSNADTLDAPQEAAKAVEEAMLAM